MTFQDVQDLESVRRKFVKALLILSSNADVGKCWMDRSAKFSSSVDQSDLAENLEVMQEYVLDLERHARVVDSLLNRLEGTRKLVGLPSVNTPLFTAKQTALPSISYSKYSNTEMTSSKSKPPERYSTAETS